MADSNKVRVVAVDDEPVTLAIIKQALSNHPKIELVGTGVNGREALQLANRLRPDVIVLDINMPIFNGIEAAARIRAAFPSIGVLMLTSETDTEVVKAALRAGAQEYLSKSGEILKIGDSILEAARRRDKSAPDRGLAFVWSFYGPKGNSGTSTLAVNTAVHLSQLGYQVLLIDLDMLHGDCAFMVGLQPRPPREHLLSQLEEMGEIDATMVAKTVRALKIPGMEGHALHLLDSPSTFVPLEGAAEDNLQLLIEFVMAAYDYVVVDLPPGRLFDRAIAPLLDFSERVFMTSQSDLSSLKAVTSLSRVLSQTSFSMHKLHMIFAGMLDQPGFDHLDYMRKQNTGARSLVDMPVDRESAQNAMQLGVPLMIATPDAPLAQFTRKLVEDALNLPPTHGEKGGSRWQSMFSNFKKLLGR